MSDLNSDLITQEVDEEVRRERMKQLWSAYGKYLIGLAVGIVLLVGGREGFKAYVENREQASSAVFETARENSAADTANAAQIWQTALPELEGGYQALGRMRLAASAAANGDTAGAVVTYDAIASDTGTDASLRSLARLFAGMLVSREGTDLEDARARLSVVAIQGEPWYFSAVEQLALVDIQKGDKEAALAGFTQLVDDTATPQSVRSRATQLKAALEEDLGIDPLANLDIAAPTSDSAPAEEDGAGETSGENS